MTCGRVAAFIGALLLLLPGLCFIGVTMGGQGGGGLSVGLVVIGLVFLGLSGLLFRVAFKRSEQEQEPAPKQEPPEPK